MYNLKSILIVLFLFLSGQFIFAQSRHTVIKKIPVSGDGKWDFVTFDESSRRLYISHGTIMQILDVDIEKMVGEVNNTLGIHGIALATPLSKGYTSNGKDSTVTVFDLKSLKTLSVIKLNGNNPDHIIYDSFSKNIFAFNNKSSDVSIIDPATDKVIQTVPLGGFPELAVSDGKGTIYVNLENTHQIAVLSANAKSAILKTTYALAPGEEPTGLALDLKNKRLFSVCANKLLVILNAENGKVITTLPIGEKVDGVEFDPSTGLIYTSNGEGSVTIIKQSTPDTYSVVETVKTSLGAKTLAIDLKKHQIYIPNAEFTQMPDVDGKPQKPTITKGTFGILVIGKN